jgi:hypothetical protein
LAAGSAAGSTLPPRGPSILGAGLIQTEFELLSKAKARAGAMLALHKKKVGKLKNNLEKSEEMHPQLTTSGMMAIDAHLELEKKYGITVRQEIVSDIDFAKIITATICRLQKELWGQDQLMEPINLYINSVNELSDNLGGKSTKMGPDEVLNALIGFEANFFEMLVKAGHFRALSSHLSKIQNRLFELLRQIPKHEYKGLFDFAKSEVSRKNARIGILLVRSRYMDQAPCLFGGSMVYRSDMQELLGPEFSTGLIDLVSAIQSVTKQGIFHHPHPTEPYSYSPHTKLGPSTAEFANSLLGLMTYLQNIMAQQRPSLVSAAPEPGVEGGAAAGPPCEHALLDTAEKREAALKWLDLFDVELLHLKSLAQELYELAPKPRDDTPIGPHESGFMPVGTRSKTPSKREVEKDPVEEDPYVAERLPSGARALRKRTQPAAPGAAGTSAGTSAATQAATSVVLAKPRDLKRLPENAEEQLAKFSAEFERDCARCQSHLETRPPSTTLGIVEWMNEAWTGRAKKMRNVAKQLRAEAAKDAPGSGSDDADWSAHATELARQLDAAAASVKLGVRQQLVQADHVRLIKRYRFPQASDWAKLLQAGHVAQVSQPQVLPSEQPNTLFECRIQPAQEPNRAIGVEPYAPVFLHIHTKVPVTDLKQLMVLGKKDIAAAHLKSAQQVNLGAKYQQRNGETVHRSDVADEFRRALLIQSYA